METIRWGILGTGNISSSFAQGLQAVDDAELVAIGSRSQASADKFAETYHVPQAHSTYADLANNPDVDVVYIGTPHTFHAENMKLCLNAGKHVLCEKPFTINAQQAEDCIALAREKNLFLMEAVWMRFLPAILEVQKLIDDGEIGDIRLIQADFSFYIPYDADHRLFNLELGGGALLDVGIYPISFANLLMGMPDKMTTHAVIGESGADEQCTMLFEYPQASALLAAGITGDLHNEAVIKGTRGKITIDPPFFAPTTFTLHRYGEDPQKLSFPMQGNGYNYEAQAVNAMIRAGEIEHSTMSLNETYTTMQLMDTMRADWGLKYPQES